MAKGRKTCPNCGTEVGARAKVCKECEHKFIFKFRRKRSGKEINWKELEVGDQFRTVQGSGSYYVSRSGEKIYFSEKGIFKVKELNDNGIQAWGKNGYTFIYTGKSNYCEETLTHQRPYKIRLIRKASE